MPSPNAVFTELVTTTFRNHRKEVVDNVSKHNAAYRMLAKGKRVRTESGGLSIAVPLEYAANNTYQRYSGLDVLNVAQSDVLSAAAYGDDEVHARVSECGGAFSCGWRRSSR